MQPAELSDGARQLLFGPIDSFEKLDVLLTIRAGPGPVGVDALVTATGLPRHAIVPELAALVAAGLLAAVPGAGWRWSGDAEATAGFDQLAATWSSNRPAVLEVMTRRAFGRIRASAARAFSDAFRIRRRPDDGDDHG